MLSSTDPKVLSSAVTVFDRIVRTIPQAQLAKFASAVRFDRNVKRQAAKLLIVASSLSLVRPDDDQVPA